MSVHKYNMNTIDNNLDLKLNALSSRFRRLLLGLIYTDGPLYQSDILKHVGIESNKLAYHLNILYTAGLVDRDYERNGKNISKYSIKEDGVKFLSNIGAIDELKGLAKSGFQSAIHSRSVNRNRSETRYQGKQHTRALRTKRQVITA
jgi:DNA-binding HxlR family transcriptional regulator